MRACNSIVQFQFLSMALWLEFLIISPFFSWIMFLLQMNAFEESYRE